MPLHHPALTETLVLDSVSVAVRLAVLLSLGASQEHGATNLCAIGHAWKSGRSSLQLFSAENDHLTLCRSIT